MATECCHGSRGGLGARGPQIGKWVQGEALYTPRLCAKSRRAERAGFARRVTMRAPQREAGKDGGRC